MAKLNRRRQYLVIAICTTILALVAIPQADGATATLVSLELTVADADAVVRATIEQAVPIDGDDEQKVTLRVTGTLKGKTAETLECVVLYVQNKTLAKWQNDKTELLVSLARSERFRRPGDEKPMPAEWWAGDAFGPTTGSRHAMVPLDGKQGLHAATMDFTFLTTPEDILELAKKAIKADAETKIKRDARGSVPTETVGIPWDSPIAKVLQNHISSDGLVVPINELAESAARKWTKDEDIILRLESVKVLSHFKSDENAAILKKMLSDPEQHLVRQDGGLIADYPVRAAALAALRAWGIEASAVVSEPAKDS